MTEDELDVYITHLVDIDSRIMLGLNEGGGSNGTDSEQV